jgi:hypothetical protein
VRAGGGFGPGGGTVTITGGTIQTASASGSLLSISGGEIEATVGSFDAALVEISGGRISGELIVTDTSSVVLSGTGFNFPPGEKTKPDGLDPHGRGPRPVRADPHSSLNGLAFQHTRRSDEESISSR